MKILTLQDFLLQPSLNPTFESEVKSSMFYAGIGSRRTPNEILEFMTAISQRLEKVGYILRSGGAIGADLAFEKGVKDPNHKEIFYKEDANDLTRKIALHFHPSPDSLKKNAYALDLMARNTFQIFGRDLNQPVSFVMCYTPDGCSHFSTRTRETGGTAQAIAIASFFEIPIYNLANKVHFNNALDIFNL